MENMDETVKKFHEELDVIVDKLPKSGEHTKTFTSIVDILKVVAEKTTQVILCEDDSEKCKIQNEIAALTKQLDELLQNN